MCGIAGYFSKQQAVKPDELRLMTKCIAHRGPDADGFYFNETNTVGLGHRRLSIIDLSESANQPMISQNGRYVIVFNGEVYNFRDIAKQLNIHARTSSDTEIILEAFAQMGPGCVHLFNGMFAIAIYDNVEDALYLMRDRLGVKPLYYSVTNETLVFASEIKALLKCKSIAQGATINKNAAYTFLYAGYIPEPCTIYNNIQKFPAGSYGVFNNGSFQITSYWKPHEKISATVTEDFASAKNRLKELLESSVQYRMISDVPFGTFLSGGIDSSIITAIAQKISDKPVNTFSIGFKESKYNESEYAKNVSQYLGTKHHEFIVTEQDALEMVDQMLNAYDEPFADSSALPTMLVSKLARQHVTMTLSGDGGDELFMGYGFYNWAQRLHHPLWRLLRKPVSASLSLMGNRYKRAGTVFNYKSEERIKSHIFSQEQYFFSEEELNNMLLPEFLGEPQFEESVSGLKRELSPVEQQALFDIRYYLKDDLLVKVDIASMQFSLETRTPFLDYRVVEFALNVSEKLKRNKDTSKYLLKEALYDYVPREYFERPKWGFAIPLNQWLKNELAYLIRDYLNEEVVTKCGIVKYASVKQLISRFNKGEDYLYNRLWVLILMHRWLVKNTVL
ncbi:MAG: asparagine synthase (glutamine-hydrolyzing) [Chitinophagales bacterium]|nr:asparagine synthase (glutamine-hydrolyzing) [Chitinophagales bacterium]